MEVEYHCECGAGVDGYVDLRSDCCAFFFCVLHDWRYCMAVYPGHRDRIGIKYWDWLELSFNRRDSGYTGQESKDWLPMDNRSRVEMYWIGLKREEGEGPVIPCTVYIVTISNVRNI